MLYDKVVIATDYQDYVGSINENKASVSMIFKSGEWQLMLQPQKQVLGGRGSFDVKRTGRAGAIKIHKA